MGKTFLKNTSKHLSSKYSQKLIDHAKQSTTDVLKNVSKQVIQKPAKVTGDLICNTILTELQIV